MFVYGLCLVSPLFVPCNTGEIHAPVVVVSIKYIPVVIGTLTVGGTRTHVSFRMYLVFFV